MFSSPDDAHLGPPGGGEERILFTNLQEGEEKVLPTYAVFRMYGAQLFFSLKKN